MMAGAEGAGVEQVALSHRRAQQALDSGARETVVLILIS
jgi:hypothetical protein